MEQKHVFTKQKRTEQKNKKIENFSKRGQNRPQRPKSPLIKSLYYPAKRKNKVTPKFNTHKTTLQNLPSMHLGRPQSKGFLRKKDQVPMKIIKKPNLTQRNRKRKQSKKLETDKIEAATFESSTKIKVIKMNKEDKFRFNWDSKVNSFVLKSKPHKYNESTLIKLLSIVNEIEWSSGIKEESTWSKIWKLVLIVLFGYLVGSYIIFLGMAQIGGIILILTIFIAFFYVVGREMIIGTQNERIEKYMKKHGTEIDNKVKSAGGYKILNSFHQAENLELTKKKVKCCQNLCKKKSYLQGRIDFIKRTDEEMMKGKESNTEVFGDINQNREDYEKDDLSPFRFIQVIKVQDLNVQEVGELKTQRNTTTPGLKVSNPTRLQQREQRDKKIRDKLSITYSSISFEKNHGKDSGSRTEPKRTKKKIHPGNREKDTRTKNNKEEENDDSKFELRLEDLNKE